MLPHPSRPPQTVPPVVMRIPRTRQVLLVLVACGAAACLLWVVGAVWSPFDAAGGNAPGTAPGFRSAESAGGPPAGVLDADGPPGGLHGRVLFGGRPQPSPPGGGQMWDIVVYLKGPGLDGQVPPPEQAGPREQSPPGAVLDQFDMTFVPHVVTLQQGGTLELRNSDTTLHNMHGVPRLNQPFNLSLSPQRTTTVTLPRHEFFRVGCDYHPQMSAWVAVLPNPFYTRVDEEGRFSLSGIPAGEYDLVGWRENSYPPYTPHLVSMRLRVAAGETTLVELDFP